MRTWLGEPAAPVVAVADRLYRCSAAVPAQALEATGLLLPRT